MRLATPRLQSSVLFVQDIGAARQFYEDLLGQRVLMDHGPNVGFEGGFALWQADRACQTVFGRRREHPEPLGHANFELYFEADDLEAVWSRLSEAQVAVVHPLREQPWGQRVFRVSDPDGHLVEVGEPMPTVVTRFAAEGLSIEAIAERTSMPVEMVRQIIAQ